MNKPYFKHFGKITPRICVPTSLNVTENDVGTLNFTIKFKESKSPYHVILFHVTYSKVLNINTDTLKIFQSENKIFSNLNIFLKSVFFTYAERS